MKNFHQAGKIKTHVFKVLRICTNNEENFEIFYQDLYWKLTSPLIFTKYLLDFSLFSEVIYPLEDYTTFLEQFSYFEGARSGVPPDATENVNCIVNYL